MKRMLTTLLVGSALAIAGIEARPYLGALRSYVQAKPHESKLGRFVKVAERVETPLTARADRGERTAHRAHR